jgi:hypothetical protein
MEIANQRAFGEFWDGVMQRPQAAAARQNINKHRHFSHYPQLLTNCCKINPQSIAGRSASAEHIAVFRGDVHVNGMRRYPYPPLDPTEPQPSWRGSFFCRA